MPRTNEKLWTSVKKEVLSGSKGGSPGQWSARKAQYAVYLYKKRGGRYSGPKDPKNSLTRWSKQKWTTKSGKPSKGKLRYLPKEAWRHLSPAEKASLQRSKRRAYNQKKQYASYGSATKKVMKYIKK